MTRDDWRTIFFVGIGMFLGNITGGLLFHYFLK